MDDNIFLSFLSIISITGTASPFQLNTLAMFVLADLAIEAEVAIQCLSASCEIVYKTLHELH